MNLDGTKWLDPIALTNNGAYPQGNLHSAVVKDHSIIVFGGKSNKYSNSTFVFDTKALEFAKLETKGIAPAARYGHSAIVHENIMYVFGGYDNEGGKSNDLFTLDLATNTWNQVKMTEHGWPEARYNHHAVLLKHKKKPAMIVFGGTNGTIPLNEVLEYDLTTKTWVEVKVKGDIPEGRTGFVMALLNSENLLIHGGQNAKENKDFTDVFILNTRHTTLKWNKVGKFRLPKKEILLQILIDLACYLCFYYNSCSLKSKPKAEAITRHRTIPNPNKFISSQAKSRMVSHKT